MKRRRRWLPVLVLLLAAANLWRWSAGPAAAPLAASDRARLFRPQDFALTVALPSTGAAPLVRDLFAPPAAEAPADPQPEPPPAAPPPEQPPPKSAEQVARETAQQELSELRLVGIVFREGKGRAYLVKGEEVFLVAAGDKLGSRFTVEKVSTDHVELRDPDTQLSGRVDVNGE